MKRHLATLLAITAICGAARLTSAAPILAVDFNDRNAGPGGTVKSLIVWIDRFHLALSDPRRGVPPLSERDPQKGRAPTGIGGAPSGRVLVVFSARAYPQAPRQSRASW